MTRRLTLMGLMVAAALALSFVESFFPRPPAPGAKLGLANIVTVAALYAMPARDAALVLFARVVLGGMFSGGASFLYSAAGAALSFFVMAALRRAGAFRIPVVSAAGGAAHELAQLFVATRVLGSPALWSYLPALAAFGALTGAVVGLAASALLEGLKRFGPGDGV